MTTAVAAAYGSDLPPRGLPHFHPQQLAQFGSLAAVAVRCDDPARLADLAEDLLRKMGLPPHAAGYLEVPSDLLASAVPDVSAAPSRDAPPLATDDRRRPDSDFRVGIERAIELLERAERPLIWAGSGSVTAAAGVVRLAELLGAPILITHSAKRGFGHADHPLVVAYPPHELPVADLVETSDVAVVLGSDLDAMMTRQFALRLPEHLVHVDVETRHVGMQYRAEVAVIATVETAVAALVDALPARRGPVGHGDGGARAARAREATVAALTADSAMEVPVAFLAALDAQLPPDAVVVCDMAIAGYWAAGLLDQAPSRRLLYPIGWGTLGFGIPAAIGGAVAARGTRTVCIAGDAGASYALGELATIAQEQLPITIIVVDDGGYGMLGFAAQQRFGRTFATDLATPDYAMVAGAFGIKAWAASLADERVPALLRAAIRHRGPNLHHLRGQMPPPRMALLGSPAPRIIEVR